MLPGGATRPPLDLEGAPSPMWAGLAPTVGVGWAHSWPCPRALSALDRLSQAPWEGLVGLAVYYC